MTTVLIGLAALLVLTAFGVPVLALLGEPSRRRLLPALPLFGVMYLVVVGHVAGLFVGVRQGIWIAAVLAIGLTVLGLLRTPLRWRTYGRSIRTALYVVLAGGIAALIGWTPSLIAGSHRVIQASTNHDAVWYIATARWLTDNRIIDVPFIGTSPSNGIDAVLFGPAIEAARNATRVGQDIVLASINSVTGIGLVDGFSAWIPVWALLGACGVWLFGEAVRLTTRQRLVAAVVVSVSASLANQVVTQNADSILGIALVLASIGMVGSAVSPRGGRPNGAPLWVAAATVTATLGVYSEYLPFLGVALASVVLIAPRVEFVRRLKRAALIVAISAVLGPAIWYRTLSSTLTVGGIASKGGGSNTPEAIIINMLGPLGREIEMSQWQSRAPILAAVIIISGLMVGLIFALSSIRTRGIAVGSGIASLVLVLYLTLTANSYVAYRAVDMATPLLTMSAFVGWVVFAERLSGTRWKSLSLVPAIAIVGVVVVNLTLANNAVGTRVWSERVVTNEFEEVQHWVDEYGGADGADVTVAVSTLWDQLWLAESLAEYPDVAWVGMRGDLGYRGNLEMTTFWDGEHDRYVLVGPGAFVTPDASMLEANDRFQLVDLHNSSGVVAVPVTDEKGGWNWTAAENGSISTAGPRATIVILAGGRSDNLDLELSDLGARGQFTVRYATTVTSMEASQTGDADVAVSEPLPAQINVQAGGPFTLNGVR